MSNKCPICKKGTPLWFISWADMATLLLCLFVILFSMSTVNATKFKKLQGTMKDAFGFNRSDQVNPVGGDTMVAVDFQQEMKIVQLIEKIELMVSHLVDNGDVEVKETKAGFFVKFAKKKLFNPNSLEIHAESQLMLSQIATLLQGQRNDIQVSGQPDPNPPPPLAGLLNPWAAGMVESQAVASFMIAQGGIDARRVKVVSYGQREDADLRDKSTFDIEIGVLKTTEDKFGD